MFEKIKEKLSVILAQIKGKEQAFLIENDTKEEKKIKYEKCIAEAFQKARESYPIGLGLVGKTFTLLKDSNIILDKEPTISEGKPRIRAMKILAGTSIEVLGFDKSAFKYIVKTKGIEKGFMAEDDLTRNLIKQLDFYERLREKCRKEIYKHP